MQNAVRRVNLSLESLLLNGIPYGVIHQDVFTGFLEKTIGNLRTELAKLQECARLFATAVAGDGVSGLVAKLANRCESLIELVSSLITFRTLPVEQIQATVTRIQTLWAESVRLIQELQACAHAMNPSHVPESESSHLPLKEFLANLEKMLHEERAAANIAAR